MKLFNSFIYQKGPVGSPSIFGWQCRCCGCVCGGGGGGADTWGVGEGGSFTCGGGEGGVASFTKEGCSLWNYLNLKELYG